MDGQKKNTIALIIAMMIIASSIYNVLSSEIKLKEAAEAFFSRQATILSTMGENIAKEGIPSAVLEAFGSQQKDGVNIAS